MERECPRALEQTWVSHVMQWPFLHPSGTLWVPSCVCESVCRDPSSALQG